MRNSMLISAFAMFMLGCPTTEGPADDTSVVETGDTTDSGEAVSD